MKTCTYELIGWFGAFFYILAYGLLIMKRLSPEQKPSDICMATALK